MTDPINPNRLPCPHGRVDFRICPHCLGINASELPVTSLLDSLEQKARAATPGDWTATDGCCVFADGMNLVADTFASAGDGGFVLQAPWPQPQCARNASYLAACSPETILKLVAVARAAVEWKAGDGYICLDHQGCGPECRACAMKDAIDALEAKP